MRNEFHGVGSLRFNFIWMEDLKRHLALKSIFIRFEFPNPIKRRNGTHRQSANQNEWQMWCRLRSLATTFIFEYRFVDSWILWRTKIRRTNSNRFQLQDDVDHVPYSVPVTPNKTILNISVTCISRTEWNETILTLWMCNQTMAAAVIWCVVASNELRRSFSTFIFIYIYDVVAPHLFICFECVSSTRIMLLWLHSYASSVSLPGRQRNARCIISIFIILYEQLDMRSRVKRRTTFASEIGIWSRYTHKCADIGMDHGMLIVESAYIRALARTCLRWARAHISHSIRCRQQPYIAYNMHFALKFLVFISIRKEKNEKKLSNCAERTGANIFRFYHLSHHLLRRIPNLMSDVRSFVRSA